jgi:hypothetical protein
MIGLLARKRVFSANSFIVEIFYGNPDGDDENSFGCQMTALELYF